MAAGSIIGALRVILGADTASFEKGLKSAKSDVASFAAAIENSMKIATAAFATAAGAMGLAIQSGLAQADKIGKAAQKMGIPAEELSKLQHAASLSDVSLEQLGTGVGKLSKNLVESLGNPATISARALAAIGVSAKDSTGQLRPTSDVISDIAERFSGMKDGAGKTAIAMALFGKSGTELIPMLNSGKVGLQEMKDEAARLGLTITDQTAKAAERFNDDLTKLRAAKEGVALAITARLAPALADISNRLVAFVKENDVVTKAADGLTRSIVFVADNMRLLGNVTGIFVGARIVSAIAGMALGFVTLARSIASATLATTLLNAAKAISIARIATFAGIILYATSDSITARLSAGEFVMPAMQTQQYLPALNAMRDGDFSIEGASNRFDAQPPRAPQIIEVRGIDPEKFYTGDNIRYLIEGLNTALADGYVLKVKRA